MLEDLVIQTISDATVKFINMKNRLSDYRFAIFSLVYIIQMAVKI